MSTSNSVFASSAGESASITSSSGQCARNASSCVRQLRGSTCSDGNLPPSTYLRAVFRSTPARIAARPTRPCFVISSISFLTCASVVFTDAWSALADHGDGRSARLRMGRCNCRPWGDVTVAQQRRDSLLPMRYVTGPRRDSLLPTRYVTGPRRDSLLPTRYVTSPRRDSLLPTRYVTGPRRDSLLPTRYVTGPRLDALLPMRYVTGPRRDSLLPTRYVTSPRRDSLL